MTSLFTLYYKHRTLHGEGFMSGMNGIQTVKELVSETQCMGRLKLFGHTIEGDSQILSFKY